MEISIQSITKQAGASMPVVALINQDVIGDMFTKVTWQHAMVLEGTASSQLDGTIRVAGTISGDFLVPCDRCLKDVPVDVQIDFDESFLRDQREDELSDTYPYTGHTICLDKMIRDNLFLHWPSQVLCKQDCKGLCSVCGVDRNEISCNCQEKIEQELKEAHPLNALLTLLNEDEEV